MPRIFSDITSDKPVNVYAGMPVQEVKTLNADLSKAYEQNKASKDALDVMANNLDIEDRNYEIKKRVIDDVRGKFKDLVNNGDYQNAQFLVEDVKKSIMTDNELQSALKSRQAEKDYYTTQKERYDKGEISKEDYLTGLTMTRLQNKGKLEYDPKTMTAKNMFSGKDIVKDMSDDIAQETMNTIINWKESSAPLNINGDTYTTSSLGGVEKVFKNGVEVRYDEVANALKQHILNQDKYRDFLNQKLEFNKFNMLADPTTGEKREFNRDDLAYLKDNELQTLATGISSKDIERLKSSSKPEDKALAKEAEETLKNLNLNDSKTLEGLYDKFYKQNQINKLVYPAAEKASYKKLEYKLFEDNAALEALKDKYARGQKKYEFDLKNQNLPPIQNTSTVQKYTGSQYSELQKNVDNYKADFNHKKALYDQVANLPDSDPLKQTRKKDMLDAQSILNVAKTSIQSAYEKISPEAQTKLNNRIVGMFTQQEGSLSNWDYRISKPKLDELIATAAQEKDYKLQAKLMVAKKALENRDDIPVEIAQDMAKSLTNSKYLPILNEADSERSSRPTGFGAYNTMGEGQSGFPTLVTEASGLVKGVTGTLVRPTFNTTISNIMQEEYETNNNMVSVNDIVAIPDLGIKENSPAANTYHAISRATFENATEWSDPSGITFDKLLGQEFYVRNAKGELVQAIPDPNKSLVAPAPGSNDGMTRVQITLKDKDGNELISKGESNWFSPDKEDQRGSFILKSGNPETSKMIYKVGAQYAKQNGDLNSYYKLEGDANFGKYFAPIVLGQDSDPITVTFPDGTTSTIKMVKADNESSKVVYADNGKPVFDKIFRNKQDLMQTFQIAYDNGK